MAKKNTNNKVYVPKKDRRLPEKLDLSRSNRIPWTDKQKSLIHQLTHKQKFDIEEQMNSIDSLEAVDTKCSFISGPAGTSKTLTAIYSALKLLDAGQIEKIFYVRSAVDSSPNKLGFLKGSLEEKLGVYETPLDDKLTELLPENNIKMLKDHEFIKMESTCFLRGRNLANCVVIVDESQNLTHDELVTIISRIAEKGRIWFCFDAKQSDLNSRHEHDMEKFAKIFDPEDDFENKKNGFMKFQFTTEDIVRSEFCKYVMQRLEEHEDSIQREEYEKRNNFDSCKQGEVSTLICESPQEEWCPSNN